MTQSCTIQISIDDQLKREAEELFEDIGIDMQTAIVIFLKQSLIQNGLPFDLKRDPFYSRENMRRVTESIRRFDEDKGIIKDDG